MVLTLYRTPHNHFPHHRFPEPDYAGCPDIHRWSGRGGCWPERLGGFGRCCCCCCSGLSTAGKFHLVCRVRVSAFIRMERAVWENGIDLLCFGTLLIQLVYLITVSIYAVQRRSQVDDFPNVSRFIEIRELDPSLSHFCFLLFNAGLPQEKMYFQPGTGVANRTGDVGLCPTAAKKSSPLFLSSRKSKIPTHHRLHHGSSSPSRSTGYKHSSIWRPLLASSLITF
jgi:hypothetical protein